VSTLPQLCSECIGDLRAPDEYMDVRCAHHAALQTREGLDDARLAAPEFGVGSQLEGGIDGRAWCDLLHRKILLTRGRP
jgi:hypothetical protein